MSKENLSLGFSIRSDTNWTVQPQKMARGLVLEEGLYYLCSENVGTATAQLICVFVFIYAKCMVFHEVAQILKLKPM